MKYQIVHLGQSGNASRIARAVAEILPAGQYKVTDMDGLNPSPDFDAYIICFELKNDACPFALLNCMEELEGKSIALIGISTVSTDKDYQSHLESQIAPFLPENCIYHGLHLCKGRMTEEDLSRIYKAADEKGGSINHEKLMALYEESQSHPDMMDLHNVLQFVNQHLRV